MVIYKSYTKELSKTMIAREKRLQRMSTMPNIKIGEIDQPHRNHMLSFVTRGSCWSGDHDENDFARFRTLPVIEIESGSQESGLVSDRSCNVSDISGEMSDLSDASGNCSDVSDHATKCLLTQSIEEEDEDDIDSDSTSTDGSRKCRNSVTGSESDMTDSDDEMTPLDVGINM